MKPKIDSLESDRLRLEIRKEAHAAELFELLCEKDLYLYLIRDIPPSKEWLSKGFKELEMLISHDGKEICLGWIGIEKDTKAPVGIFEVFIANEDAFLAYTVFKKFQGNGFAAEACLTLMDYVSKNYKIKRFVIEMDTRNRASTKVAEKLGFEFVKVVNNACFLKNLVSHEFQFQKLI